MIIDETIFVDRQISATPISPSNGWAKMRLVR